MLRISAILLLLAALPPATFAGCPDAYLRCYGGVSSVVVTTDPIRDFDCSRFHVQSQMSFDHVAGLANAQSMSMPGNTASASLDDNFILTGPPDGTVIPITVVGDLELQNNRVASMGPTYSSGQLWTPPIVGGPIPNADDFEFTASAPGTETTTHQLRLPMNVRAGHEFEISLVAGVYSSGEEGGYSHARLSFEGLPPGSSMTSCKGYRQDQPVPALARSWGGLKAIYR